MLTVEETQMEDKFCAKCSRPILDEYLTTLMDQWWHEKCVQCDDCGDQLTESCYSRNGGIFCQTDFYRRFAPKCSGCDCTFRPTDLVRKARDHFFHVNCFVCAICHRQLMTGDQLFIINGHLFVCKQDYCDGRNYFQHGNHFSALTSQDIEDNNQLTFDQQRCQQPPSLPLMSADALNIDSSNNSKQDLTNDHNLDSADDEKQLSKTENITGKRRGPRTTIKTKQLEMLKSAFNLTPKPSRHLREQLAKETGLPMRVIQVWFQNKRSKERRMRQICNRNKYSNTANNFPQKTPPNNGFFFYDERRPELPEFPADYQSFSPILAESGHFENDLLPSMEEMNSAEL